MTAAGNALPCLKIGLATYMPHMYIDMSTTPYTVTGTMIQLMAIISKKLNRCYEFVIPKIPSVGYSLPNGSWTGVMGHLSRREVDMVGVPFKMDDVRAAIVDFSVPLYMDRLVAAYKRPSTESDLAAFVKPYTALGWLLLLLTMLAVFFWIFFVQRLRSLFLSRWFRSVDVRAPEEGQCDNILTTVWTSLLWTLTAPLAQSSSWWPKGDSVRVITGLWLLMSFIVGTVYRSNLKAMLIIPKLHLPFNSVEELLETDIPGFIPAGSIMHQMMREAPAGSILHQLKLRSVFHFDIPRAVQDVLDGNHAAVVSFVSLTTVMNDIFSKTMTCPIYVAREPLFTAFSLGFGFPKGSPLKKEIDPIIRSLRDFGILEHLYSETVQNGSICLQPESLTTLDNNLRPLDLGDFYGVFFVYGGGMLLAVGAFLLEIVRKCFNIPQY